MFQRETINVIELGLGMCFLFSAAITQGFTVQPVLSSRHEEDSSVSEHAGYYSSTLSLISYTVTNLFAAPLVMFFGPKWSLVLSSAGYTIHMLGFLYLNIYFLYFSSTVQGISAAVTWTAAGVLLAQNSCDKNVGRNSGIMWILTMISMLIGGIFLLFLFSNNNEQKISVELTNKIYAGFACFCILAGITFALMKTTISEVSKPTNSWLEMKKSVKLMKTADMALLFPLFLFIGLESALYLTLYPTALVYTNGFHMNTNVIMAWNSIVVGIGQITAGLPLIIFGERVSRLKLPSILRLACLTGCISFILVFINIPGSASYRNTNEVAFINPSITVALLAGFLMGICDSFTNIGVYSFVSVRYAKESAQANSIMKFVSALPNIVAVYAGSLVELQWQLLTTAVAAICGLIAFLVLEKRTKGGNDVKM